MSLSKKQLKSELALFNCDYMWVYCPTREDHGAPQRQANQWRPCVTGRLPVGINTRRVTAFEPAHSRLWVRPRLACRGAFRQCRSRVFFERGAYSGVAERIGAEKPPLADARTPSLLQSPRNDATPSADRD
jgi:hypothetical protein